MAGSYRTGFAVVEEAAKKAKEAQAAGNISHAIGALRSVYWKEDGEKHIVRFLSDNIITFPIHEAWKGADGKYRDVACTEGFPDGDPLQRPCYICKNLDNPFQKGEKAKPRNVSLGIVVQQEKEGKNYVDETRELELLTVPGDPNSPKEKSEQPIFAILKQGNKFWNDVNGYYSEFDTTVDRPYSITRRGLKKETTYTIAALTEDAKYSTPESLWEKYDIPEVEGFEDPIVGVIVKHLERIGAPAYVERHLGLSDGGDDKDEPFDGDDDEAEGEPEGGLGGLQERLNKFKANKK